MRVVLVGLGLIGGSIALALRRSNPNLEIIGVDQGSVVRSESCWGLCTRVHDVETLSPSSTELSNAGLIVLAAPVRAIKTSIANWLGYGVPVTDCGSTKRGIVESSRTSPFRDWFLPGHPMAGRERGGLSSADPDLFRGRPWIVCPESVRVEAIEAGRWLVATLGAIWTEMAPAEHDNAVALSSHVPQVLASWLAANANGRTRQAAGPAFSDMTRIAGGAETIWSDIFATNAHAIADILLDASNDLSMIADELNQEPPQLRRVLRLLARARALSTR